MDTSNSSPADSGLVTSALDKLSDLTADSISYVEESTRRSPLKALSFAIAGGYLLRQLPVFGIFGVFFRLGLLLIRPAALIFGGVKLCQFLSESSTFKPVE